MSEEEVRDMIEYYFAELQENMNTLADALFALERRIRKQESKR